ncbi:MAG: heme ABC transporter ATP-binding protein [Pseudomonadota bacterium]
MSRPIGLDAEGVCFSHGAVSILNEVNGSFAPGTVTALIGPNGAGKSTLLRVLAGELKPSAGCVRMNGQSLDTLSSQELALKRSVMSQSSRIVFDFLVEEVLRMGWLGSRQGLKQGLENVIVACEIEPLLGRTFNTLSGGEQQRIQFARALLQIRSDNATHDPNYLLLDEPTSNLDVAHELAVLRLAREVISDQVGVVVVLHDLNLASRFADQLMLLKNGQVQALGAPEEVLDSELLSQVYATPLRVERHNELNRLMIYS